MVHSVYSLSKRGIVGNLEGIILDLTQFFFSKRERGTFQFDHQMLKVALPIDRVQEPSVATALPSSMQSGPTLLRG